MSWIEIEKKFLSFVVVDRMHAQYGNIYGVLAELFRHMTNEGKAPIVVWNQININFIYIKALSHFFSLLWCFWCSLLVMIVKHLAIFLFSFRTTEVMGEINLINHPFSHHYWLIQRHSMCLWTKKVIQSVSIYKIPLFFFF